MDTAIQVSQPWNKGLIVGQKRPLLPRQVWSIRVRLEISGSARDLALFNLAIDSKLRTSDLVQLKVETRAPAQPFAIVRSSLSSRLDDPSNSRSPR